MEIEKKESTDPDERLSREALQAVARSVATLQTEALAASAGALDKAAVAEIVGKNTKAVIDATGAVKVTMIDPTTGNKLSNVNGTEMTPGQFIAQLKADPDHGYLFKDGASKPKAGGLESEKNPWHRDTINLTEQARLLKSDPNSARIYQDAARGTLPDNPWSKEGFNLTLQSKITRDDPALAERMKSEVAPKEPNPWMKGTENLTKQAFMRKSDPTKARRLQSEAEAGASKTPPDYRFTAPPGSFRRRSGIGV